MEILAQLFGNIVKVKLLRLFLFNPESVFSVNQVSKRLKAPSNEIRKELTKLIAIGVVKKRSIVREIISRDKKREDRKVHDLGYSLDQRFMYLQALKNLLITVSLNADDALLKKFASVGRIKLFLASGVFIQEWETRIDLLIVGDDLNMARLDVVMKSIESEIGKEISYSAFETPDFEYRLGIHDKLIRDILDAPHTILIDRIGLTEN